MEWRAEGILLAVRKHGENAAIIETLTAEHGRHAGLVRGGAGRRYTATLQPGNQLDLTWRGRLADHLGNFSSAELLQSRAGPLLGDREALATLDSARSLLCILLPEREALPTLYAGTFALFDALHDTDARRLAYARWELMLLSELGFALDLKRCAVTGATENLAWVSPRSGRAVTAETGKPFSDKLLKLPQFLNEHASPPDTEALHTALTLTGYFLETWAIQSGSILQTPPARQRLMALLSKTKLPRKDG